MYFIIYHEGRMMSLYCSSSGFTCLFLGGLNGFLACLILSQLLEEYVYRAKHFVDVRRKTKATMEPKKIGKIVQFSLSKSHEKLIE